MLHADVHFSHLGGYAAVIVADDQQALPDGPPWRPLAPDLENPATMVARLPEGDTAAVRRARASVMHLGFCARLITPFLAAATLGTPLAHGGAATIVETLWWRDDGKSTFDLAVVTNADPGDEDGPAIHPDAASLRTVATTAADVERTASAIVALASAIHRAFPQVPATARWGNAASAVNGAASVLQRAHPERRAAVTALVGAVLDAMPDPAPHDGAPTTAGFRRRSCCQLYRLPGFDRRSLCGDCILR